MDKKVAVLLAQGFEEIEALSVVDFLRRAGIDVQTVSITDERMVPGAHNISVEADIVWNEKDTYDAVVLPGGRPGADNLANSSKVLDVLKEYAGEGKYIGAICAAPKVLANAEITNNIRGTGYPGLESEFSFKEYKDEPVVVDGNIITSRGPATAPLFAMKLIEVLIGKKARDSVQKDLLMETVFDKSWL